MSAPAPTAPPVLRFPIGALEHSEGIFNDQSKTITTSAQTFDTIDIPAGGFLREVYLWVVASGGAAAGSNAVAEPDAPYSAISEVTLMDPTGTPVVGPISGYQLYLAHVFCGAAPLRLGSESPLYTAVDTGGNFAFGLRIPVELNGRDAVGALPNGFSNSTLKLRVTLAATTGVYSTSPNTLPSVRIRVLNSAWIRPTDQSPKGMPYAQAPAGVGTTSMWSAQTFTVASGSNTIQLKRVGNMLRELVFVSRDSSNDRSSSIFTAGSAVRLMLDGNELLNLPPEWIRHFVCERLDVAGSDLPAGVYAFDWCHEFDGSIGGELRDQWLHTTPGTRLELQFTAGATGYLDVLTNDVAVPGGAGIVY